MAKRKTFTYSKLSFEFKIISLPQTKKKLQGTLQVGNSRAFERKPKWRIS